MTIAYRGEGVEKKEGCSLLAHYTELQVFCDALGFAAQKLQAGGITKRGKATPESTYWYGVFQGLRTILRAVEGNVGELEPLEREMLVRINWKADPPYFDIPGMEHVRNIKQHLPGEGDAV